MDTDCVQRPHLAVLGGQEGQRSEGLSGGQEANVVWLLLSPPVEGNPLVSMHLLSSWGHQTWCWLLWGRQKRMISRGLGSPSFRASSLMGSGVTPLPLSSMSGVTAGQEFLPGKSGSSHASKPKTLDMDHRESMMVGESMGQRSGSWSLTHPTSLILWGKSPLPPPGNGEQSDLCPDPVLPAAQAVWNLPVYIIHGLATAPQPAVAAVAHKGQDGILPRDGFHHGLQVEQAAVCCRQDCKGTKDMLWAACRLPAVPTPRAGGRGRRAEQDK